MSGKITISSAGSVPGNPDTGYVVMYAKSDGRLYSKKPDGTEFQLGVPAGGVVESVNGASGVVVLDTDDISEGAANLYYTDGRFDSRFATAIVDYVKLAGRASGQTVYGGTGSGESLNLYSTSHATKGPINIGLNFKEYSNGTLAIGPDNALTPPTSSSVSLRVAASGRVTFEHSSGQPWHVYPTTGNWQFTRSAADKIGFGLDTSSRFLVGDGSPISVMCVSESNASTTPGALSSTVPVIEVRNRSTTTDNFSGVVFEGSGTAWDSGVFGVHNVHTSGSQTGWLELWASSGGARAKIQSVKSTGTEHAKGVRYPIRTVSGTGSVTDDDYYVIVDAASGAFTLTLPTAVGRSGKTFIIKRINTGADVTLACTGGQTIDGAATKLLGTQWISRTVFSDGSNWLLV